MRHPTARSLIARGEITPEVSAHLDACADCSWFAAAVERVVGAAPELGRGIGDPPPELADRVLASVGQQRAGVAAPVPLLPTGRPAAAGSLPIASTGPVGGSAVAAVAQVRRPVMAALSVAASALLLVGTVAAVTHGDETDELQTRLAAAATAIDTLHTYRFSVEGEAEVVVRLPEIPIPDMPDIPTPTFPTPSIDVPQLPPIDPSLPPEVRQQLEENQQRLRAQLQAPRTDLQPPAMPTLPRIELPSELSTRLEFAGQGEVVQPDRLHFAGRVDSVHTTPQETRHSDLTEVTVVGGEAWVRAGGGRWVASSVRAGPFGGLVFDANGLLVTLQSAAAGRAHGHEDLGEEELDGVPVRHLRFTIGATALGLPTGAGGTDYTVDVWLDAADQVRQARYVLEGRSPGGGDARPGMSFRTTSTIRIFDEGADLTVEPPPADQVDADTAAVPHSGLFFVAYPFHLHVWSGFNAALPGLPEIDGVFGPELRLLIE